MEWMGFICLIIILCYSSYPNKIKNLEGKVKRLERKISGGNIMSKVISSLIGKQCKIQTDEFLSTSDICTVIDADNEWLKVSHVDKKNITTTKIIRIDSIENIELVQQ